MKNLEAVCVEVPYRQGTTLELQTTLNKIEDDLCAGTDIGFVQAAGMTIAEAYDMYACQVAIHRAKRRMQQHINRVRNR